jgi:hypothetical protein
VNKLKPFLVKSDDGTDLCFIFSSSKEKAIPVLNDYWNASSAQDGFREEHLTELSERTEFTLNDKPIFDFVASDECTDNYIVEFE